MKKRNKFIIVVVAVLLCAGVFGTYKVFAEQSGSTPESGVTSRILSLYNDLSGLTFGSDSDTPDWGTYWNRIKTAAKWVPSGTAVEADVASGKTFYNTTRGAKTGAGTVTNLTPAGPCPNQQYHDSHGAPVTESTNCSLTWTTNSSPQTGDDDLSGRGGTDPRTGLTYSQALIANYGFTVSAANATAGATYTNNGAIFKVVATISGGTSLNATGTGGPLASGTLTKSGGTGDATITFSAVATSVAFSKTYNSTWTWGGSTTFTVTAANATAGATYTDSITSATFTVVTTISGGTSLVTTGTGAPSKSGTLNKASGTGDATITFSAVANGINNAAVGGVTAQNLCLNMNGGGVWRLPTQNELMQTHIDGSYFNLTQPSNDWWSATEYSSTSAWAVNLDGGHPVFSNKSAYSTQVRCVR